MSGSIRGRESVYSRRLVFSRSVLGRGFATAIAIPAIRRVYPPELAHRLGAAALNIAWVFFFRHVWGLRSNGDQEAFATVAIFAAAILSYRRIHWFMLRGRWYADLWFHQRVLGVRLYDWFDIDPPKSNPRKKDQREAIMKIAHAVEKWEQRTALRTFPEEHSHHWEWTGFGPRLFFSCHCGLRLQAFASDFGDRFTNDDVTRLFESRTRSEGWWSPRPDWPDRP